MEKLKLVFIGKNTNTFTYKGKQYRPYYIFGEKYNFDQIAPYLDSTNDEFNYSEFSKANTQAGNKPANIYACLSDENENSFYAPVANDKISKFNVKAATTNVITENLEPKPISNKYIIATANSDISRMMKLRGCTVLNDNNLFLVVEESKLIYAKKFRDDLKMDMTVEKKIKTKTGYEDLLRVRITEDKKTSICKGVGVFSLRNNKYYAVFNYNGDDFYFEKWFNETGDMIKAKKDSNAQSNRIYEWRIN